MRGSGIGGSSQERKSTDLIKVATRERRREGGGDGGVGVCVCVRVHGRVFTAGHNHRVSITSCPRYYAHAAGKVVMWEARPGVTRSSQLQVHHNVDAKKKKKNLPTHIETQHQVS